MKKTILAISLSLLVLTGCASHGFNKYYNNTSITKEVEGYQLDLRIYGSFNSESINKMYKIDNYKNEKYKVLTERNTYYLLDDKTYKSNGNLTFTKDDLEEVDETLFHDTDLILKGLKNVSSKKEIANDVTVKYGIDITALETELPLQFSTDGTTWKTATEIKTAIDNDIKNTTYTVYEVKFKKKHINELLKALNLEFDYKEVTGKIYLTENTAFKITYEIDDLIINGSYYRINNINERSFEFKSNDIDKNLDKYLR